MPSHPVAREMLRVCNLPIAAPSANLSTRPSPTTAAHVLEDMNGRIPLILNGGACEVGIESFKEGAERYDIGAVIYVMRESQKGIVIGRQGAALKKVGTQARIDMEDFFQKKVFLQIYVKVDPDWRESKRELRKFGYED